MLDKIQKFNFNKKIGMNYQNILENFVLQCVLIGDGHIPSAFSLIEIMLIFI